MAKAIKQNKPKAPVKKFEFSLPAGRRAYAIVVFCVAFGLYFNAIFNDYNLDDELVTNNQALTSQGWKVVTPDFSVFSNVSFADSSFTAKLKYFAPQVFRSLYYQDKSGYKYEYRPLAQASFAIEHAIFAGADDSGKPAPDNPHISHFINVVLYALTCVLLFLMLARLLSSFNIVFAFVVALFFTAHPIHTEVVASIKNRDEIMALMFALISGIYALKFAQRTKPVYLLLVAFAFLLSLLSKPTAITFAMLIPVALIMFSTVSFSGLMMVTSVMAALAAFYSRFYFAKQQVALFGLIILLISLAYVALHFRSVFGRLKSLSGAFVQALRVQAPHGELAESQLDFGFLRKPWLLAFIIFSITLVVAFADFAAHQDWYWLSCGAGLIFALAYLYLKEEGKIVLITPITITLLLQLYNYKIHLVTPQVALGLFLVYHIFSGNRYAKAVAVINYILFALAGHFIFHTPVIYLLLGFSLIGFYYPRFMAVSILAVITSLYYEGSAIFRYAVHGQHLNPDNLRWPLFQLGMILNWRGKKQFMSRLCVVFMPVIVLAFAVIHPPAQKTDLMLPVSHAVKNFTYLNAIDPTPVQSSVRPLKYVEFPVAGTDSYSRRFGLAAEVLIRYLKLVVLPYPMSYYYGYAYITPQDISAPLPLLSLLIYTLIFVAAIVFYWRKPLVSFALLFYLISISVYTDLIAPIPGVMADRFLLVPSIGFCLIVVFGLFTAFKQSITADSLNFNTLKNPLKYTLFAILVIYSIATISRNTDWKDHLTLFRHDISTVENSAQAQNLLAVRLIARANHEADHIQRRALAEEAVGHFKKALEVYPDFVNASFDLGRTYEFLDSVDQAYAQYAHTTVIDTGFTTPCFYMAVIQHNKGNYRAAIPLYEKYISKNRMQIQAYANLSYAYYQLKDFDKSIEVNKRALTVSPDGFSPLVNIGKTYIAENKPDSALIYFQMAHAVKPGDNDVNHLIERFSKK